MACDGWHPDVFLSFFHPPCVQYLQVQLLPGEKTRREPEKGAALSTVKLDDTVQGAQHEGLEHLVSIVQKDSRDVRLIEKELRKVK